MYYWAEDDYDDDPEEWEEVEDRLNLGTCCSCQQANHPRNILTLRYRTPYGFGWGCFQCGLEMEGAIAVICDECLENAKPTEFIKGEALKQERAPIEELTEPFEHRLEYHPEVINES